MYSAYGLSDYVIRVLERKPATGRLVMDALDQSEYSEEAVSRTNQMLASAEFAMAGCLVGLAQVPHSICPNNPLMTLTYPARVITLVVGRGSRK